MTGGGDDATALWLAVVAVGVYHGLNPAMGWPLAVARGLEARSAAALFATLAPLGAGHLAAMAVVLLPFALLGTLAEWSLPIRVGAGALVLAFGIWRLVDRRHPRWLVRVPPARLALWSFLVATAHGAGLMLLPITLGLCGPASASDATGALMRSSAGVALAVALLHTLAMIVAGLAVAWLVYRTLGLRFLNRGWLNLEVVWGASLVVAGGAGIAMALAHR